MRNITLSFLAFLLASQVCFSSNSKSIKHSLGGYSMVSIAGDIYPGQMLGVEYNISKGLYGLSSSYSQFNYSLRYYSPFYPTHLYSPRSYSSKIISITPFFNPVREKWFALTVYAGGTFSREDRLGPTITSIVTLPSGNYRLMGEYLLETDYVFGVTFGIGFDFDISKSVTLFANSKGVVMQYPGIGLVLVGGGIRFNI